MTGRLENKVAIITGAAMGLGAADAELFASEGAKVVLTDIAEKEGQELADKLNGTFFHHDVTDEDRWIEIINETEKKYGRIDVLVNNAGIVKPGDPENQTTEEYKFTMSVHMDSTFFGCKYVIPVMAKNGGGSCLLYTSDAADDTP